jgi:hypothetical protein
LKKYSQNNNKIRNAVHLRVTHRSRALYGLPIAPELLAGYPVHSVPDIGEVIAFVKDLSR